ncbi:MAG: hypothetical protein A2452_09815 [Candidatus Firestonebacteria bacterium RIFOXYC2_FULL_39_67]|nr:MAG: hypothetical protein A2536_03955 [Candidatus Firestonebacteria bacterium RIFOXYD2_FULL_39_29]OGF54658.1 MAG: hypothetical protein A2452_09815 [Candidatus Firestonebacteria bacterium RIFOXYC2_FULL_39_67]OGF56350.1 MAG: hypothetical protein A2497_01840 [Candidatus Firestonebacteria bacterium RifOxyC12_full_39_7]
MDSKKLKYSLIILAIGLLTGFALTFWLVPDNPYIPGNDKAGLETGELDAKYKYNIEEYKKVDPKLVLYGEYAAENHGGNSVDECGMNNKLNSTRRNSGRKSAEVHKELPGFKTEFDAATGIVIDKKDRIYICGDTGVKTFDANGKLLSEIPTVKKVTAIAVMGTGIIYAALQDVVYKDVNRSFGKKGKAPGEFEYITSMKINGGRLFIADAGNRRVSVFDLNGKYLYEFGRKDAAKGIKGFIIPSPHMDLDFDKDGNLWVANTGMLRLEKYSPQGVLLFTWGKAGSKLEEFIGCCNPANFAIMSDGSFITSEKGLPRIKLYGKTGKFIGVVAPPSSFNEKCINMALAVDSKNRVYALDSAEKKVRIFERK